MATPAQQLARELRTLRREVNAISRASQMSHRSIEGGGVKVFDTSGTLRGVIGIQPDGTAAVVTVNDPAPSAPSAPILEPTPGGLLIGWDGTYADHAAQRSDVRRVDVYCHAASLPPSSATVRASFLAAATVTLSFPVEAYSVFFVTVTTGGSVSSPSLSATETPASPGTDQDARDLAAAAQQRAEDAITAAHAAQAAAEAAESSSEAVTGAAAAAQQAADDAATQAAAALAAAQLSSQTGTSAQQAADLAQAAADAAKQAADTAGTSAAAADAKAAQAAATAAQAIADAAAAQSRADKGVTDAGAALTAANGKNRIFTQATQPTGTAYIAGDLWIDTANGRRVSAWDPAKAGGAGWVVQQFGNLAIAPGTLVASDVLVQGTVTSALIKGDAIDGKTITGATIQTAASGARVVQDANGLRAFDVTGTAVTTISNADGSISTTKGTITGATIRTAASGTRLTLDSANGLRGIDASSGTDVVKTQVGTNGTLTAVDATVTGVYQTAQTGPRLRLGQINGLGRLDFYSGYQNEDPGGIRGAISTNADGSHLLSSALFIKGIDAGVPAPSIGLYTLEAPAGGYYRLVDVGTDSFTTLSPVTLNGQRILSWAGQNPDVFRNVPFALLGGGWAGEMFIDGAGIVHLEASLKYTGTAAFAPGGVMATLPASHSPRTNQYRSSQAGNSPATVQVLTNGQVIYSGGPSLTTGMNVTVAMSYLSTRLSA